MNGREILTTDRYYPFFQQISEEMRKILPPGLKNFDDKTVEKKNFMVVKYKARVSKGQYEFHFASHSKLHAHHFGDGHKTLLCFYRKGTGTELEHWLKKLLPFKPQIEAQLGHEVKIGSWSDEWAFIGIRIDERAHGSQPAEFAKTFAQFIQATFVPVTHISAE